MVFYAFFIEPFGSKEVEEVVTSTTTTPTSQEIAEKPSEHELNPGVEAVVENKAIETGIFLLVLKWQL